MPTFKLIRGRGTKILLLNPNSSSSMTDGMKTVIDNVGLPHSTEVYTYTGPSGAPASINDGHDIEKSVDAVLADFDAKSASYSGIVVACFSVHPLVPKLQALTGLDCAVTGIFEASVLAAISLLKPQQKWGIVTTGKFWENHLAHGVDDYLGVGVGGDTADANTRNAKFAGVQSTGLNASDFHNGVDPAIVRKKLKEATKRLFGVGGVHVIVMGCAGMAGLEDIIREAACDEYGEEFAYSVLHVIDGVRAAVMQVDHMIRNNRLRPGQTP